MYDSTVDDNHVHELIGDIANCYYKVRQIKTSGKVQQVSPFQPPVKVLHFHWYPFIPL